MLEHEHRPDDKDACDATPGAAEPASLRRFWPLFYIEAAMRVSVAGLMLNMVGLSQVIWPGDAFHSLEFGIIISAKLTVLSITGVVFGTLADRLPRRSLMVLCLAVMAAGDVLAGFSSSPWMLVQFVACYSIVGAGQGGIQPIITSIANDDCHQHFRSRFFGTLEASRQLALISGMFVSAVLIDAGLWRIYFWLMGSILASGCAISVLFLKEPRRGFQAHESLKQVISTTTAKYGYKLTPDTVKSTIFSRTNMLAFFEGVFTWILFSVAIYLIYPWIQDQHHVTATSTSALMAVFGVPGVIIGSVGFSRMSDRLARRSIKFRVYMITGSILALFGIVILLFVLPLPDLENVDTGNLAVIFSYPVFFVFGGLIFVMRAVLGIYHINQTPVLQVINLPEAQGFISSANQFLETIGYAIGPLVAGILLTTMNNDYPGTALISLVIGLPSVAMWLLANRWIDGDISRVDEILQTRAVEMARQNGNLGKQ
ncbi:MAG: MFS transporter [Candidatus Lokiarchaeota archaeon]|nr:MFS transporter [Candidatus Lokiarchaeota archaeon]